jgi:tRNA U34 5-methylaminomethyl-2-thiouridine-forming methyltransferase MnmC
MEFIKSSDGSFTLFSEKFNEHYHSTNDGALSEALYKHVIPALSISEKRDLNILDISFGLGFNSFTTIYSLLNSGRKVKIVSPEIDEKLIKSLKYFPYPKIFEPLQNIIYQVSENGFYKDENFEIDIHIGDAREFIKNYSGEKFDIVYQDPFSPIKTPNLWSIEYFKDLRNIVNCEVVLTTYSTSTPVRLSLFDNGFKIYSYKHEKVREGTIASLRKIALLNEIDMERKRFLSSKGDVIHDV